MSPESRFRILIGLSLLGALVLETWPIPTWLMPWWPHWIVVVIIFWAIQYPKIGYSTAWIVGLLHDFVTGSLIGTHVLSFSGIIFLCGHFTRVLSFSDQFWRIAPAGALLGLHLLYVQLILLIMLGANFTWVSWWGFLSSLILWPFLCSFLLILQRRTGYQPTIQYGG